MTSSTSTPRTPRARHTSAPRRTRSASPTPTAAAARSRTTPSTSPTTCWSSARPRPPRSPAASARTATAHRATPRSRTWERRTNVRAVRAYGCALVVVLAACRTQPAAPSVEKSAEGARAAAPARDASPRSMKELPTTDHTIAVGNLQAQIADYEKRLAKAPNGPAILKALVGLYAMRAQFFSRLDDYDRAGALAERLVKVAPADGEAWAARAGCRASMHRFQDALADLDEAERRGVRNDELAGARASIYQALGRYGDAAKIRERKAREWPTLASLGALASLRAEEGNTDEAERLFIEAQDKFSDVSPFSLAWLYLQEGLMWQKAGYLSRARELFEAAHERLPEYAPVTSHLASVEAVTGSRDRAIALVRPLVDGSDDP